MFRDRLQENHRQRAQQIFGERMATLFDRLPMLSGFCVESDLKIAVLTLNTWPGWDPSVRVAEGVVRVLQDLVDEQPDAAELLRGRTFARCVQ